VVARLDFGHAGAHALDNASAFVAEDRGERRPQQALLARNIGVANPHADDPD
jgi:hypothetical protein